MSARVCIQQWHGLAPCLRGGSRHARTLPTPPRSLFLQRAGRLSCGRLTVNKTRFRPHKTRTSKWCADYTDSRGRPQDQDVRRSGSDLGLVHGEGTSSDSGYAQSTEVEDSNDGHILVNRIPESPSKVQLNGHANGHAQEGSIILEDAVGGVSHNGSPSVQEIHVIGVDIVTQNGIKANSQIQKDDPIEQADETLVGASGSQAGVDDLEYYVPVAGDRVVGVVVSGNHAKIDVDIGAAKLGHLHVQNLLPLDRFSIDTNKWILADDVGEEDGQSLGVPSYAHPHVLYDEEVFTYEAPGPLVVDIGTVLEMEVVGQTISGKALLSARKAAQSVEWDRVVQIKDENEPFEVTITDHNASGVIARVEGLRAFLPQSELIKQPDISKGESHEAYVGRTLWVTIAFAREIRGNIIISEKDAWIKRNLQCWSLHDGTVIRVYPYGALVQVNETDIWGMIHISNIANARIDLVSDVFEVGEQVKMIVVECPFPDKYSFSTALLESEPGLMLRDKQRVFSEAEERATALRNSNRDSKLPTKDDAKKPSF